MESEERLQEEQYRIPYHYLPVVKPDGFSQVHYWSWGYRYLGRLQMVMQFLERLEFGSLVDIGCGDGRFLHELSRRYAEKRLMGVDVSLQAIGWARRMNPELTFETRDIRTDPLPAIYDVVTLLDVIEHIPPDQLDDFITAAIGALRPGGWLILSAPHTNMPLDPKHFQHINPDMLDRLLKGKMSHPQCTLFDGMRWPVKLLLKLMGGSGRHFIVTSPRIVRLLYQAHQSRCLHDSHPRRCQRVACLAQKVSEQDLKKESQR